MSQNSITINNGTGEEVRAAINAALNSLATDFSGDNEPPAKWALMKWADTANLILKMRNLSNTAWIDVMDLDNGLALNSVPVGFMGYYAVNAVPPGWLECDGSAVSRTTYARLFALIGTTCGKGDGLTTFNVPDIRGEFIRGYDHGRGVDPGRTFGTVQGCAMQSHRHLIVSVNGQKGSCSGSAYDSSSENNHMNPIYTGYTGDGETRPRNIAFIVCIKY